MVGNAASTLKLIEMELRRFLGNEVRHINALSRRGAGLEISAVNCECWKAGRIMYEQSNLLPSQLDTSSGISGSTPCAVRSLCTKLTQIGQCKKLTRVCKHASKIATVAVRCRWISRSRVKQARCHSVWQCIQNASREPKQLSRKTKDPKDRKVERNDKGMGCSRKGWLGFTTTDYRQKVHTQKRKPFTAHALMYTNAAGTPHGDLGAAYCQFEETGNKSCQLWNTGSPSTQISGTGKPHDGKDTCAKHTDVTTLRVDTHVYKHSTQRTHRSKSTNTSGQELTLPPTRSLVAPATWQIPANLDLSIQCTCARVEVDEHILSTSQKRHYQCRGFKFSGRNNVSRREISSERGLVDWSIPTVLPQEIVRTEAENQLMEDFFVQHKKVEENIEMLRQSPSCNNFRSLISLTSCHCDCRMLKHVTHLGKDYDTDAQGQSSFRFRGGGAELLQCFICLVYKRAYVSKQWSDEYVTHCRTCGRGACNEHGAWEVGQFHCPWK